MAACASILLVSCGKDGGEGEKEEPVVQNTWPESGFSGNNYWYLSNGAVQIGVDLSRGGCVFHFSEKGTKRNLINHYDNGRFIQQSYYDGKTDGSVWNGKNWRWNPIQGGGWKEGTGAKIIKREKSETSIEIQTQPVHWATCEALPECGMTETITLGENYAIYFNRTRTK